MPYLYEIIKIYKGKALNMSKLEKELKKQNKENLYLPKLKFHGRYECFQKLIND